MRWTLSSGDKKSSICRLRQDLQGRLGFIQDLQQGLGEKHKAFQGFADPGSVQYTSMYRTRQLAEFTKIANYRRLVAVNQSEPTAGPTGGWRLRSVVEVVVVPALVIVVVVALQSSVV